ncbi:nucleoside-diphosphate-sugar epimerase [Methylovorus glucosotrophus]|uniref:UDP-glucose 4-epimerase family protein n=1 Tax=Methylovorus glucosotrophus TaxID=266009 RepID=UPI001331AAA5|nr:SDR family oxidoreductase [Methylovorus glucosotrophus]KAF0835962.1 nucleoside-diphosphate-sugar epimerase [Methylovorus glucosotrophus]
MTILVTGANGFVGSALCNRLEVQGSTVRKIVRSPKQGIDITDVASTGEITANTDWTISLKDVATIIHLAARVHVMSDKSADPLSEFRRTNVEATINLARQAADMGIKRFIFLSSVKVNGESTEPGGIYSADDDPAPEDAYGVSKFEAEQALLNLAAESAMEVVIIRPPLVYGPGVKANFANMIRWLASGVPLPLGAITNNRRSLVALDNLVDLIITCIDHPAAANQIFLVSDGEDLSSAELLTRMAKALGKPARLFFVPIPILKLGAILLNKRSIFQRLCGSLQVDIAKTRQLLGWNPPITIDEGLRRAAQSEDKHETRV